MEDERGVLVPGLSLVVYEWCRDHAYPLPSLLGTAWAEHLPSGVIYRDEQTCRRVYHLTLRSAAEVEGSAWMVPSWSSAGYDALTVLVQLAAFALPTAALALTMLRANDLWALAVAPPADPAFVAAPLFVSSGLFAVLFPFAEPQAVSHHSLNPVCAAVLAESAVFMAVVVLRVAGSFINLGGALSDRLPDATSRARFEWVRGCVDRLATACLMLHLWLLLAYLGVVCCWCLLTSVLQPTLYLPYGASLVTLLVLARTVADRLASTASRLRAKLRTAVMRQVSTKLARAKAQADVYDSFLNPVDDSFDAPLRPTLPPPPPNEAPAELTALDVFAMLKQLRASVASQAIGGEGGSSAQELGGLANDADDGGDGAAGGVGSRAPADAPNEASDNVPGDAPAAASVGLLARVAQSQRASADAPAESGAPAAAGSAPTAVAAKERVSGGAPSGEDGLSAEDFNLLFQSLDLSLTEAQVEKLFASTDLDGNGCVTASEFESAWDDLIDEFVSQSVAQAGFSPALTVLAVAVLVLCAALVLAFVLVTLSAFVIDTTFDAVVQSILVASVGKAAAAYPGKANASLSEEDLDKLVGSIMGQQEGASKDE